MKKLLVLAVYTSLLLVAFLSLAVEAAEVTPRPGKNNQELHISLLEKAKNLPTSVIHISEHDYLNFAEEEHEYAFVAAIDFTISF